MATSFSEREVRAIRTMVGLYCRGSRHAPCGPCESCRALLAYAEERLARCPHAQKPACRDCPTPCFAPERRRAIQAVMRYAGWRMLLVDPAFALGHLFRKRRRKRRCE